MARNKLGDLRDHLFETLEMLKDKDNPMELDRARAICLTGQVIIESAKVEVQAMEVLGRTAPSAFFGLGNEEQPLKPAAGERTLKAMLERKAAGA